MIKWPHFGAKAKHAAKLHTAMKKCNGNLIYYALWHDMHGLAFALDAKTTKLLKKKINLYIHVDACKMTDY